MKKILKNIFRLRIFKKNKNLKKYTVRLPKLPSFFINIY